MKVDEAIKEISDGATISFSSLTIRQGLLLIFSFIVTTVGSPVLYGFISMFFRMEQVIFRSLGGFMSAIIRTIPRLDSEAEDAISTLFFGIIFGLWIVLSAAVWYFSQVILDITLLTQNHYLSLLVFGGSLLAIFTIGSIGAIFRAKKKIRLANLVQTVLKPSAYLLGFIISVPFGISLFYSWVGISLLFFIIAIISIMLLIKHKPYRPRNPLDFKEESRDFIEYGSRTWIARLCSLIQHYGAYVLMILYLNPVAAGLFSLAMVLGRIIRWPLQSVNQIFPTIASELYAEDDIPTINELYKRTSFLITVSSLPLTFILTIYSHEILTVFSPDYADLSIVLPIILVGLFVANAVGTVGLLLLMTDNERLSLGIQAGIVLVVIYPWWQLTQLYGVIGLAIGYMLVMSINNGVELIGLYHREGLFPFTYNHFKAMVLATFLFGIVYSLTVISIAWSLFSLILMLYVYGWVCWNYLFTDIDKLAVKTIWRTRL